MTHRTESGQSLILLAAALTALLGFMSLAIDAGRWFVARQRVVNVCDMAALGGAMELTNDPNTCARAQRAVLTVVDANAGATLVSVSHIIGPDNPDIIISHYNDTTLTNRALSANIQWTDTLGNPVPRPAPNRGLIVRGRIGVPPVFGRVIGYSSPREVGGRTAVVLGQASTIIGGILPFGVSKDHIADIESSPAATIEQVLTYRTWNESWAGAPGAFGTLGPGDAPGSTSADDLQFNITWAYPGAFQVGQTISVTSGNMTGALRSGLVNRLNRSLFATIDDWLAAFNSTEPAARSLAMEDSRLVMFPIIDQAAIIYNGTGSAERVVISGFATYVVSQWSESGKQVYGYFVKSAYEGSVSPSGVNYGTLAYHLL